MNVCLGLLLMTALSATHTSAATNLFVAPSGAAQRALRAVGTRQDPFLSVHDARDHIRRKRHVNEVYDREVVRLLPGSHVLDKPLTLDARDSDVSYVGSSDGETELSGGVLIPKEQFVPSTTVNGAFEVDLVEGGAFNFSLSDVGSLNNPYPTRKAEVFYGSKPMTLARDPNIEAENVWRWVGYDNMSAIDSNNETFIFRDVETASRWADSVTRDAARNETGGFWLHGYWKFDWRDTFIKLESITKNGSDYLVTRAHDTPPQYDWKDGVRFYAVNSLGLLDHPSEYYISASTGKLYFIPPEGVMSHDVIVSKLPSVVSMSGASNVSFENMKIRYSQGNVVEMNAVVGVNITSCDVSNGLGTCLSVSKADNRGAAFFVPPSRHMPPKNDARVLAFERDVYGDNRAVRVENNTVYGCGGSAISISGGDVKTLETSECAVVGNECFEFARIKRTYQPGIAFQGVGHYIANNTISNCPHTGLTGGGNDHLFEFNVIRNSVYESIDAGAFYVGRSWAQRGNVARFNEIDTVRSTEKLAQASCSQNGFYLDDEMSGWEFYGNVVRNATTGVLLGGGRRNVIRDNYFEANDKDVAFDNRGMNWQSKSCAENCSASLGTSCFHAILVDLNYQHPPYSVRYPEIVNIYRDRPCTPVYNVIADNRYCHDHSPGGGEFIDRDNATVQSWGSVMRNNTEACER